MFINSDLYRDKFQIVLSSENTPYMAWQAKLFFFSCLSQLNHSPIIVVHNSHPNLHADFRDIIASGGNVCCAANYRINRDQHEYPPRNIPGTLLHAAEMVRGGDVCFVLCDADMIFVGQPDFPRSLAGNFYGYMNYEDRRIKQITSAYALRDAAFEAQRDKNNLRCGPPYVIPAKVARDLAIAWLAVLDEFAPFEWIDVMYAFGLAIIKLKYSISEPFNIVETDLYNHLSSHIVIHYYRGDDFWDKRRFMIDESILELWSEPIGAPKGTALGEIESQIQAAERFYRGLYLPQGGVEQTDDEFGRCNIYKAASGGWGGAQGLRGGHLRSWLARPLEDDILIACARLHFDELDRDRVISACQRGRVDWELVYDAAVAHKIAPLVYRNLQSCESVNDFLRGKIANQFQDVSRWNTLKNAIASEGIAEMVAFFDNRSHNVLLLKHAAFSLRLRNLYDLTMSDDIDVVVRPKGELPDRLDKRYLCKIRPWMFADRLQKMSRWLTYDDLDHTSAVIREFGALDNPWRRLIGLELDNRIHHDVVWGGVMTIDFRTVWQDANWYQVEGRSVYVPDDPDLIIMNSVNIHRKPFLRLRNIVEIHELVRLGKDLNWDVLTRKARAYQCNRFLYSALHATKVALGSELPESVLRDLRPGVLRGRVIAFVNRRVSPSAICCTRNPSGRPRSPRRGLGDVARRFLAFDAAQLICFLWFRIILHKLLGVIKW
jgi:hypothetical protein